MTLMKRSHLNVSANVTLTSRLTFVCYMGRYISSEENYMVYTKLYCVLWHIIYL